MLDSSRVQHSCIGVGSHGHAQADRRPGSAGAHTVRQRNRSGRSGIQDADHEREIAVYADTVAFRAGCAKQRPCSIHVQGARAALPLAGQPPGGEGEEGGAAGAQKGERLCRRTAGGKGVVYTDKDAASCVWAAHSTSGDRASSKANSSPADGAIKQAAQFTHIFCILTARKTAPVRTRANAAPAAAPASSRTSLTAPVAGAVSVAPLYRSCVRQSTSACASRFPSCCRAIWPVHSRKWTGAGPSRRRIVSILPKSAPRQGSFPRFSGAGAKGRWAKETGYPF